MASKFLRRLLRRSEVSFFISSGNHKPATSSTPPAITNLACTQGLLMPARTSHSSCLPLPGARHCLPPSSSSTFLYSSADEDDWSANIGDLVDETQLARSHSCSKLQNRKQRMPSFRSLLHPRGASSLNHRNHADSCGKLREFEAEIPTEGGSKYSRPWSSPSLHMARHIMRLPSRARSLSSSSHTSPDHSYSRGRCAPKGHVAVYVEAGEERHLVPIAFLTHPLFQALLERAEREYGFRQEGPGLRIPCSLSELHHTLHHNTRTQ